MIQIPDLSRPSLLIPEDSTHLLLLVGLPGSGKSFLAAALLQADSSRRVVSTDAIRSRVFGNEATQGAWRRVWREVERQLRQTVHAIDAKTASEAIYDATNVVRKQRRQAIALARYCGFQQITGLWLQSPLWLCLERNQQRDRTVPPAVILQMHRSLQGAPPSVADGLDRLLEIRAEPGSGYPTPIAARTDRDRWDNLLP